jgi:hypothetical protein
MPDTRLPTAEPVARRYVSLADAALYSSLSILTLRRLADAGKLTLFRPSPRRVLVDLQQLDQVLRGDAAVATASA